VDLKGDIQSARLIVWKGFLFLACGILASVGILAASPTWTTALLLGIALWACCRWYYFMFYVIQHYVDPSFRFAGLGSFVRYMLSSRRSGMGA
jgi:hypothetical protein